MYVLLRREEEYSLPNPKAMHSTILSLLWFGGKPGNAVCRLFGYCNLYVLWLMNPFVIISMVSIWVSSTIGLVIACQPLRGWRQHMRYMVFFRKTTPWWPCSGYHNLLKDNGFLLLLHLYDAGTQFPRQLEVYIFSPLQNKVKDDNSILLLLLETMTLFLNLI